MLLANEQLGPALGMMAGGGAIGGFTFFCAFQDYDWFMMNSRAAIFRLILGRAGARIFYMLLGVVFIAGGLIGGAVTLLGR